MRIGGNACNSGCGFNLGTVGTPNIVQGGLQGIWLAAAGEVTGGTPLALTVAEGGPPCDVAYPFIAIEALGSGFVILVADSNVESCVDGLGKSLNCDFFCRWCDYEDTKII